MRHLWKTRPWKERGPATDILAELARDPLFVAEERERDARQVVGLPVVSQSTRVNEDEPRRWAGHRPS